MRKYAKTQAELAKACGISPPAMCQHMKEPGFQQKTAKGWDIVAVKAWLKQRRQLDKAKPKGNYAEELIAKTAAQRAILELDLELKRGNLLVREDVELRDREFISTIQSNLLNAKTMLARLVSGKTGVELESVIDKYFKDMIAGWKKIRGME